MQLAHSSSRCTTQRAARGTSVASLHPVATRANCFQSVRPCISAAPKARILARAAAAQAEDLENRLKLTGDPNEPAIQLPAGYHWYETMIIMKPTLSEEERDRELAKFEAFLNKEECQNIYALVRGRSRMAYPIKSNWEGIYVLYTYAAKRQTARTIQLLLSNPESGSEDTVLRFITFCKS